MRYCFAVGAPEVDVRKRPGCRSARVREAVLQATIARLPEGWEGVSVPEIAAEAGVHTTSIYRRWGTRENLIIDALLVMGEQQLPIPDTGTLHGDLTAFASQLLELLNTPFGRAFDQALASPTVDPKIVEASASYFRTRFEKAGAIIDRAVARNEIPACENPSFALEMLVAPLHLRLLLTRQPLDDALPAQLADQLISGLLGTTQ